MSDIALEKGLPHNLDAERFVLGAVLMDDANFPTIAMLVPEDFSLESHRRIYARMCEIHLRSERIDRVTVINELRHHNQLESCGGFSYLTSLDDGLPVLANLESWVRIVREKARLRGLIFESQKIINRAIADDGTSAHELAKTGSTNLLAIGTSDDENKLASIEEIISNDDRGLSRFLDHNAEHARGIQTGFRAFDEMTGGLQPGDLDVFAARPSMGKTAICLNIAAHAAGGKQRLSVAIFSLEMSRDALLFRMMCSAARVNGAKAKAGYLNREEKARLAAAAKQLREAKLFIDDSSASTVMDIGAKLRRLRSDQGVDLAMIDYLGLIPSHRKNDNRVRELGEMTRFLKLMVAKEFNIPVLLLSQLSRAPDTRPGDHRPMLSDLRDSGDIEQDADLVAFIYREEIYKPDHPELRGLAELIVAKQRNGPVGRVNLTFLQEYTRFESRASFGRDQ